MIDMSLFQKHIHKVKFYPSADDFTHALLVMLVTNITSVRDLRAYPSEDIKTSERSFKVTCRLFNR